MRRAVVYARISDSDGDAEHLGINRQLREGREYCESHDLEVVGEFPEDDRSASAYSQRTREQYEALVTSVEAGEVDAVVARHADRLWRRPGEAEGFLSMADRLGIEIHFFSTAHRVQAADPSSRAMLRVAMAFAALESDLKSQRIRSKHRELAEAGQWSGGKVPYGYARAKAPGQLKVDRSQAAVIKRCVAAVLRGEGLSAVVDDLNLRAVPTPSGKPWRVTTLRGILLSPRIAGIREHHGSRYTAQWPAIISPEEQARVAQAILGRGGTRSRRRTYVLSGGLSVCGKCGAWLHAQPRRGDRRSYRCLSSRGGCSGISIAAEPFEELVIEMLLHAADTDRLPGRDDRSEIVAQIEADERSLAELAQDRADRLISRDEHLVARRRIADRLQAARSRLARAPLQSVSGPGRLREAWPSLTAGEQRALLHAAFDHVVVAPGRPGPVFDPHRVQPVWSM